MANIAKMEVKVNIHLQTSSHICEMWYKLTKCSVVVLTRLPNTASAWYKLSKCLVMVLTRLPNLIWYKLTMCSGLVLRRLQSPTCLLRLVSKCFIIVLMMLSSSISLSNKVLSDGANKASKEKCIQVNKVLC